MATDETKFVVPPRRSEINWTRWGPPTVSAPDIHYTTTVDARAIIQRDSVFFIAYSKTFEKRLLHILSGDHYRDNGFDFYQPRPLYLEDSLTSHSSASVFDLLCDKFADDPAYLHIFYPQPGFSGNFLEWRLVKSFETDLIAMGAKLPYQPPIIEWWELPDRAKHLRPGDPQVLELRARCTSQLTRSPVKLADTYLAVEPNCSLTS